MIDTERLDRAVRRYPWKLRAWSVGEQVSPEYAECIVAEYHAIGRDDAKVRAATS